VSAGAGAQANFGLQPVGTASGPQNVNVTASAAGTVATVQVLTTGIPNLDFTPAVGGASCNTASLSAGSTCTQSVIFKPGAPGLRLGAIVLLDGNGNILAETFISGTGQGGLGVLVPGNVIPVAGNGNYLGQILDGDQATAAELYLPASVTLDAVGNMYIADTTHNRIRKVSAATGLISTIAGNGNASYTGDTQVANNITTTLNSPGGITIDGAGNLYIADTGNNAIRVIWAATGIITTIAGNGNQGNTGDGGPASSALLNTPWGITVDPQGNIFIADTYSHRIRMICAVAPGTPIYGTLCPAAGDITTVAGTGFTMGNGNGGFSGDNGPAAQAELNLPYAVAFDAAGNMYIPDQQNNRVRMVNPSGTITTFAGTGAAAYGGDGALATEAQVWGPSGVAVDPAGNVYIADTQNSAIRKVGSSGSSKGLISTLAITKAGEYVTPGANPTQVNLHGPIGLYLDGAGDLYFADTINMVIREIQSNAAVLDYTIDMQPVRQGEFSAPLNQTVENDGNLPWAPTAITPDQNAFVNAAGTTCSVGTPLAVNAQCVVSAEFAPSNSVPVPANGFEFGNVDLPSVAVNTPLDIILFGNATPANSTTVVVTSNNNPSVLGAPVIFTATVTTGAGTGPLVGAVTFFVDGVAIPGGAIPVDSNGLAPYTTATLTAGSRNITAQYIDTNGAHLKSPISDPLVQEVIEGTAVVLVSSQNPSSVGQSVTFTATVSSGVGGGVIPDGTVTFSDGTTILGTVSVSQAGTATYSSVTLANGLHAITALYNGDLQRQIQSSVSNTINQDVLVPSTVVLTSSPNPSVFGTPVTLTVTVTSQATQPPTGSVNFFNGNQQIGSALLTSSGQAGFINGGATGGGQATITLASLPAGTDTITAVYVGDTYNASGNSNAVPQLVKMAATATAVSAAPTPPIAGGPVVLTATVTVTQGVSTPTGTVTFTNGAITLGTAKVGANETATIPVTFPPGSPSIVATYSGDTNDVGSASTPLVLTVQTATTTSALSSSANPSVVLASVTFTVKVTSNGGIPTGNVTFSADGTSIGTATLDATGTASISDASLAVGSHPITVAYGGDANDAVSTGTLTQTVGTIATQTALGESTAGTEVILVATVVGASGPAPTGTVTFKSGNTVLGSAPLNSSGVAILAPNLPAGTENVVAIYGGDTDHSASQSPAVPVSNVPLDFTVTVTPASVTIPTSQNAVLNVALKSYSGFTDTIGLGCASLPAAVNCHFSTVSEPLVASGTQTVQLTIDTNNPLGGGTSSASAQRPGAAKALFAGLTLPLSLFFGCLFWRLRKRHSAVFTTLAVVLFGLASMALTACNGFTQTSATPGTYVIQVTGTGNNSNIEHYQNVTITITK
jgi:sugar lactone lactonase YvrE